MENTFPTWLKVDITNNDNEWGVPYECCIGAITKPRENLCIRVKIERAFLKNASVFQFDPRSRKPVYFSRKSKTEKWATYKKQIPLHEIDGVYDTLPGQNYMLICMIDPKKNTVEIWQTSVVSQLGIFFLRTQLITRQTIYKNSLNHLVVRDISYWKDLENYIEGIPHFKKMPISSQIPPARNMVTRSVTLADNEGIVLWWNDASGCGMAQTNSGIACIDWYEISGGSDFLSFIPGEHISFTTKRRVPTDWMFQPCPMHLEEVSKVGHAPEIPVKPLGPDKISTRLRYHNLN